MLIRPLLDTCYGVYEKDFVYTWVPFSRHFTKQMQIVALLGGREIFLISVTQPGSMVHSDTWNHLVLFKFNPNNIRHRIRAYDRFLTMKKKIGPKLHLQLAPL